MSAAQRLRDRISRSREQQRERPDWRPVRMIVDADDVEPLLELEARVRVLGWLLDSAERGAAERAVFAMVRTERVREIFAGTLPAGVLLTPAEAQQVLEVAERGALWGSPHSLSDDLYGRLEDLVERQQATS